MTQATQGLEGRYSKALYALAAEAKSVDDVYNQLQELQEICNGEVGDVLSDQTLNAKKKAEVLKAVLQKAKMSDLVQNFVQVAAMNGRAAALPAMVRAYAALRAAANAEVTATVLSAQPLTAAQQKNVIAFVKATDKAIKSVNLKEKVDETLMAGMKVRIGSTEYDASLRGALTDLHAAMKG